MENDVYYSKYYLEKYFKENYPINWCTWLNNVFNKLNTISIIGIDLSSQERK